MTSSYVFESGTPIETGSHGDTNYVFHSGTPVPNFGASTVVFESGSGIGGGIVIDDFEDGDFSEYNDFGGDSPGTTSNAFEGNVAMTFNSNVNIASTSGLQNYPSAGDTFELRYNINNASGGGQERDLGVFFGLQSDNHQNGYQFFVGRGDNDYEIRKFNNGSNTTLTTKTSSGIPTNEWLRLEIEWGNSGTIICRLEEADGTERVELQASDTEYTSGGWGIRGVDARNDRSYIDLVRVI